MNRWQPEVFVGRWPAWVQVLASGFDAGWKPILDKRGRPRRMRAQNHRQIRCFIDDKDGTKLKQYGHSDVAMSVKAMVERPGLANAWWKSSQRFSYPNLKGHDSVNPLRLTTDEIANLHLPPELANDPDVLAAQAVAQGLFGEWATVFGIHLYREAVLRGIAKINANPLVMVMVACPFFEHKSLLRMSPNGAVANLRDVEGSLLRGCAMTEREQAVWLSSPLLEGALISAVRHREAQGFARCKCCAPRVRPPPPDKWRCAAIWPRPRPNDSRRGFRFTHKGWWHASGCPLPPPPGRAKRVMFDINTLPSEDGS